MTLVCERAAPPGARGLTHVLAIGVGHYPWLVGGEQPRGFDITGGMDQLDSPPLSARRFADWWGTQYRNPERPLGTVELLISDRHGQDYVRPDEKRVEVERATLPNIREAAQRWSQRGNDNEEDQLVFFFSGHGARAGRQLSLLASDYGENELRPMLGAINFTDMLLGLDCLRARRQLVFIDACRMSSTALLRYHTEKGDVLVPTGDTPGGAETSVYFASIDGRPAFGQEGDVSLFTQAVLASFKGPGAYDNEGDWRLNTTSMQMALTHFASRLANPRHGMVQSPQSGTQTTFDFHYFAELPTIPVYVQPDGYRGAQPPAEFSRIKLSTNGKAVVHWRSPWQACTQCSWAPDRFESWLAPMQYYTAAIHFADPARGAAEAGRYVVPPYGLIRVAFDG